MNFSDYCSVTISENNKVKTELLSGICQCCLGESNLKSMIQPCFYEEKLETYSQMLMTCYSIEISADTKEDCLYLICDVCIVKLRDSYIFRNQVEVAQAKLRDVFKTEDHLSSPISDICDDTSDYRDDYMVDKNDDSDIEKVLTEENEIDLNIPKTKRLRKSTTVKQKNLTGAIQDKKSTKKKRTSVLKKHHESPKDDSDSVSLSDVENVCKNKKVKAIKPIRNKIKALSKSEFRKYRRIYNRQRYANSIPFKLDKSAMSCNICNETFPIHKHLVSHMAVHFPNYVCSLCGKYSVTKENILGHMKTHDNEKISCKFCNKLLKKSSMPRHIRTHSGDNKVYGCPSCPERFISFSTRVNHMAEVHKADMNIYKCKICPKTFHLSSSLSKHFRRCHLQEMNYTCTHCGKGFFAKRGLDQHMVKHTGEKQFKCDVCLKSFGRKGTLREHMKIHNNVKQHKCNVCDRSFTQKCTLKGHLRIHEKTISVQPN